MEFENVVFPIPQAIERPGWVRIARALFSPAQCAELLEWTEEHGRAYRSGGRGIYRRVSFCYLKPEHASWAFEKLALAFVRHNAWGFALSGILEPMRIQKYGVADFTNPHSDYNYVTSDQSKITAVVPLVPARKWAGGRLIVAGRKIQGIDRGDCVLFPSFAWHSVSPVTRGERVVLSAWAAGPRLV